MQVIGLHMGGSFAEASVWAPGETEPRAKSLFYLPRHPLKNALPAFLKTLPDQKFEGAFVTSRHLERLFDYRLGGSTAQVVTAGFERWPFLNAAPTRIGWVQPARSNPISAMEHSLPVLERIDADGQVRVALTMESLVPIAEKLKAQAIKRVCVHLLHANINPAHEKMAAGWFREQGFEVWTPPVSENLDEGARWRASTLEASFSGTFEEMRSDLVAALAEFVPETSVKIHDGSGFKNFADASKVGTLFADDALLARQKKYSSLLLLDIDHWSLWKNESTDEWLSPWGTVACRGPKRRPLVVQPSSALELAGPETVKAGEKAEGFEPGPLSLGRGRKLMTFDLWASDASLKESLKDQINDTNLTRRDSALLALSRETKTRGADSFLKSMKNEIAQWIETDAALDADPKTLAKLGRMASAFDQLKMPIADIAAGPVRPGCISRAGGSVLRRSSIAFFLDRIAADFPALTIANSEGTVLYSRSKDAVEAGLLPHAIEIVEKYMPLSPGDVVLIKDAFAGGPGRDRIAMITAWNSGNENEPKWLAATVIHHPSLQKLKLPPVPLRIKGETNAAVLEGLGAAREILEQTDLKMTRARELFERKGIREHFSRKALSEVTKREQAWMAAWVSELPEGEASVEIPIPTGEIIRMRCHNDGKHLSIDLSGTSNSSQLRLPFSATCGLIWTTLRERLGQTSVVDTFSADLFPVTVPNGCFLNATNGDCERGLVEIAPWIQWGVELLVHKWDKRKPRGLVNPFDIHARLEFAGNSVLDLNLPTGSPSMPDIEGTTFLRQRLGQHHIGVETIERNWPVRVLRVDEKSSATPSTKLSGGKGLHFQVELTKPANFRWNGGVPPKAKFEKHQSPPAGSEVKLLRDGEERVLAPYQDFELKAGDQVTLLSGSGGGIV